MIVAKLMLQLTIIATLTVISLPSELLGRSVYLNGSDVSGARNQSLKNVDLHINENGDILIQAAQYQVNTIETYKPLRKQQVLSKDASQFLPEHKKPAQLSPTQLKKHSGQIQHSAPNTAPKDVLTTETSPAENPETPKDDIEENSKSLEVPEERLAPKPGSKTKLNEQ